MLTDMKNMHHLIPVFSLFFLSACYGIAVPKTPAEESLSMPEDAHPTPMGLNKIVLGIPRGDTIGSISPQGLGILCRGPYGVVTRSSVVSHMEKPAMRESFYDTMSANGYDVTGSPTLMFDEDDDVARTIYLIGARITDIKMDVCQRVTFLFAYDLGYTGETSMEVEWTVYDRLRRNVIYKSTTRGYSKMDLPNYEAIGMMMDDSFAAAAHNLGSDPTFHSLLVNGVVPPSARPNKDALFGRVGIFPADDVVSVSEKALSSKPLTPATLEQARRATVMIGSGAGHGSGFFISDQGHILTNAHVVGDADQVRIVTPGGKHKIVGEVLRRDKERDVALIRLTEMPAGFTPTLLPLRTDIPKVGEHAYAIGAPLYEKDLQDTVTSGIISAWRPQERMSRQSYIQADITIQPGNSGGPLLDAAGNITGIAVAGYLGTVGEMSGLNLFIPIDEALRKMSIAVPR
jgi:S1-C subfamily serine protease